MICNFITIRQETDGTIETDIYHLENPLDDELCSKNPCYAPGYLIAKTRYVYIFIRKN